MDPVQIATQIKKLYADLKNTLADEESDWDSDYHALLKSLGEAQKTGADALVQIAKNTEGMDGDEWAEVGERAEAVAGDLVSLSASLHLAADYAEDGQHWLAQQTTGGR